MNMQKTSLTKQCLIALSLVVNTSAYAQETGSNTQESANNNIEEVVVLGSTQNDVAMSAFRSGDFKTAKEGFIKNARCALRRERALDSLITNQAIGSQRASISQTAQTGTTSGGGSGGPSAGVFVEGNNPGIGGESYQGSAQKKAEEIQEYSCENRGFQHYMLGLSQIQLGELEEALKNLNKATNLSRVLYDAHYRIGLISLMNKDLKESLKQLKKMEAIQKKCKKKCTVHDEIKVRVDDLDQRIKSA